MDEKLFLPSSSLRTPFPSQAYVCSVTERVGGEVMLHRYGPRGDPDGRPDLFTGDPSDADPCNVKPLGAAERQRHTLIYNPPVEFSGAHAAVNVLTLGAAPHLTRTNACVASVHRPCHGCR